MSETTRDVELEALARETAERIDTLASDWHGGIDQMLAVPIILAALRRVQPEPSAEGPTRAQVDPNAYPLRRLRSIRAGMGDSILISRETVDEVLALFAPPAADAEPAAKKGA